LLIQQNRQQKRPAPIVLDRKKNAIRNIQYVSRSHLDDLILYKNSILIDFLCILDIVMFLTKMRELR